MSSITTVDQEYESIIEDMGWVSVGQLQEVADRLDPHQLQLLATILLSEGRLFRDFELTQEDINLPWPKVSPIPFTRQTLMALEFLGEPRIDAIDQKNIDDISTYIDNIRTNVGLGKIKQVVVKIIQDNSQLRKAPQLQENENGRN